MQQRIAADQINRLPLQNDQDIKPNALEGPLSTRLAAMNHENMINALNSDEEDKHDRHDRHDGDDLNDNEKSAKDVSK